MLYTLIYSARVISELYYKELFYTLVNKRERKYNSVFSDFKKTSLNNSGSRTKSKRRRVRRNTSKERETNEKFLKSSQTVNFLTVKSACHQRVSN